MILRIYFLIVSILFGRDKAGEDNGHRPIFLIEGVRLVYVSFFEQKRVLACKERGADCGTEPIPDTVAKYGCDADKWYQNSDVESPVCCQQARTEQDAISRQEETKKEP